MAAINEPATLALLSAIETATAIRLDELGLTATVQWDFRDLADTMADRWVMNPAFDPRVRVIDPASFWISFAAGNELAAVSALLIYQDGDFETRVRDLSLWYDDPPAEAAARLGTINPLPVVATAPFTHGGATWVHPAYRGLQLPYLMNVIARVFVLRYRDVAHFTGFVAAEHLNRTYDYPDDGITLMIDGIAPGLYRRTRLYALHMSKTQALERLLVHGAQRLQTSSTRTTGLETVTKR